MQNERIKMLVEKYNDVLKESVQIAVAEDLFGLIIANGDDLDFELKDYILKKSEFKKRVFSEFIKLNSGSVVQELKDMEEPVFSIKKKKTI